MTSRLGVCCCLYVTAFWLWSSSEAAGPFKSPASPLKSPNAKAPIRAMTDEELQSATDEQVLAANGYNLTDDALRDEGFVYDWEFARARARRAQLLRTGGHWERMSGSLHLYYDFSGAGLPKQNTSWLYSDLITSKTAKHTYWAAFNHRLGYVGYQAKFDREGRHYSQFQCSNWDGEKNNGVAKSKILFCGKGVVCKRFGHEGSGFQTALVDYDNVPPRDGQRFAFAVHYAHAGGDKVRVSCWFLAPGLNQGRWFKQAVWEGIGTKNGATARHGTHGGGFLEQFWYHPEETAKLREGLYGTVWGKTDTGDWMPVTSSRSSVARKVQKGWPKSNWGVKRGPDGQLRWFLQACGCKFTNECPGEAACRLSNTGGSGALSIPRPSMPASLRSFQREVVDGEPGPPPPSHPRPSPPSPPTPAPPIVPTPSPQPSECRPGQIQSTSIWHFTTGDNSKQKCEAKCRLTPGCVAFDYTPKTKGDACRGAMAGQKPRLGQPGGDMRNYCILKTPVKPKKPTPTRRRSTRRRSTRRRSSKNMRRRRRGRAGKTR